MNEVGIAVEGCHAQRWPKFCTSLSHQIKLGPGISTEFILKQKEFLFGLFFLLFQYLLRLSYY